MFGFRWEIARCRGWDADRKLFRNSFSIVCRRGVPVRPHCHIAEFAWAAGCVASSRWQKVRRRAEGVTLARWPLAAATRAHTTERTHHTYAHGGAAVQQPAVPHAKHILSAPRPRIGRSTTFQNGSAPRHVALAYAVRRWQADQEGLQRLAQIFPQHGARTRPYAIRHTTLAHART